MNDKQQLGLNVRIHGSFDAVLAQTIETLKTEGFGVLTEIDVKATMKAKLDVDFRPYHILGACNPHLAHRALTAVPAIGLMLPCNITVAEQEDGSIEVAAVNPLAMMEVMPHPELEQVAAEAHEKLKRVIDSLENRHAVV
ncbi:MAG: DUF302 domain-containing protein [Aggregatilineales bacterium]